MAHDLSRRQILSGTAAALSSPMLEKFPAFNVLKAGLKPVVISSSNGNQFKNGGTETCVEKAYRLMTSGTDVLDALIEGVNILELDPAEMSVGYGGLPNADGVVQLDSSCMHGPKKWAGGVAALEGVRTPSRVARLVMERTDHHLLVGKGAQEFARNMGFAVEADLNTEASRKAWIEWKRRTDPSHYLDPSQRLVSENREPAGLQATLDMAQEGWIDPQHVYGTINCDGINANGDVCGVTTTSGLAFKIPGRVGDSPILGAGLYVDNAVGAAGSTGRGEANLYGLCSFLIIEEMRRGAHPKDAGITAMRRVAANTAEKRLKDSLGHPNFGLQFYVLGKNGQHAGITMNGHAKYAVCDENGPRLMDCETAF
jgi:N4-(beta-N-acetylglucosaminyl)-L-asparaginase